MIRVQAPARDPPRSGEDEQVAHDFRGPVRFAKDQLEIALEMRRAERVVLQHQLDVPHDALQRIVQLVRDAGDELPQRRELFRLRQPVAQLRALGFETRLVGDVARDDDGADAFVLAAEQRTDGEDERASEHGSSSSRDS